MQQYFANRRETHVGVFDETGYKMSGQSIHLAEEQTSKICRSPVKLYTCGKKGLLASRNAESTHGKLIMREEEFLMEAVDGRREFSMEDLNKNVYRGARKQFSALSQDLQMQYIEYRGCWRAVGECAKIILTGYNSIAEKIKTLTNNSKL